MRFCVATNFDDDLPELLKPYGAVELFGKVPKDFTGGGRASYMISPVSRRRLSEHVHKMHRNGMMFNYLINPACMDNREFTRSGQHAIRRQLDWLSEMEVDSLTLSIPYLIELVKRRYPHFKVKVGVYAQVDTPKKAQFYEDLGADCITLVPLTVNRDFERLAAIRQSVKCDLQLIANSNCLLECPMSQYHMVGLSHASQTGSKGFFIDYCLIRCLSRKLSDTANYIKSPWIRPEDIHHYESIGYTSFKILERDAPTDTLVRRVRAYYERHYDGNLIELVQCYGYKEKRSANQPKRPKFWELKEFLKPFKANPVRLLAFKKLAGLQGMIYTHKQDSTSFYIDNKALDGFIDKFLIGGCVNTDCDKCHYCHEYAERAVHIDPAYRKECLDLAGQLLDDMSSGRMWSKPHKRSKGEV